MQQAKKLKRVLIMAGGTGGHVFPGLALASYLQSHDIEVHWLGTEQGLESRLIPDAHIPLHLVNVHGLRGKNFKTLMTAPIKISIAIGQSLRIIKKINPDVVIGMGGFVSGPGGIASWLLNYPLIIHEQNAKAGLTNKILARFSKYVLEAFPNAFAAHPKVITVGNPVRLELTHLPSPTARLNSRRSPFRLLVLGGSLGAHALNEMVPRAIAQLSKHERPLILHQTGDKHIEVTKKLYESMEVEADLQAFVKDMANAYTWADMVLCRAGALTVAELCVVGLGAIFIPYPYAVDDHQRANAQFMVKHDAALCISQAELTATRLTNILRELMESPDKRLTMAQAAYQLRKVSVVEKIVEVCQQASSSC